MKFRPSLLVLLLTGCGPYIPYGAPPIADELLIPPPPPGAEQSDELSFFDDEPAATDLSKNIANFVRTEIGTDLTTLPPSEAAALQKLIEASRLLDAIFDRQAYAKNPELFAALERDTTPAGKQKLAYARIMRGPWDRQDHHKPFATDVPRPKGAGFYPEDLTEQEFDAYLATHPDQRDDLTGLFTIVKRDGDKLAAIPYSKAYETWLVPAAKLMREAADLTKNASLSRFLRSRADAFFSGDYYQSDKDWMDLDSLVEITIGPYEVYEDKLKAAKASFESFVTITDPKASKNLAKYKSQLADMEAHLPVPDAVKTTRGKESPIRVVDLVFSAGDARKSVQTIAFNLPNDERVRKEKGAKKVLLRNVIQRKFDVIMRPIAERIIAEEQQKYLSSDAFFNEVLFHELSHSLGPAHTMKDGKKVEVRQALESTYSAIEECKADVMGAYNILYMIERDEFPASFREELLLSYFAGLFRSVRFGVAESHGKGAAVQINRFLEEGAATFDAGTGRYTVHFDKLEASITKLVKDLCMLQHEGDKAAAVAMLAKYGVSSPSMAQALGKVADIPVDLRPVYPAGGEK